MAKASAPGVPNLPHRCREGCNFSLTERQKSPRDVFPQELSHLNGPNFLGVNVSATLFWESCDFLRFRQRANPLVVVELLRGRVFFFLQKDQLFRQVSRGPLDRENVKAPEQAPPLASSCEGDNGIQCSCRSPVGPGALIGDSLTWGNEAIPVLLRPCSLIALRASL